MILSACLKATIPQKKSINIRFIMRTSKGNVAEACLSKAFLKILEIAAISNMRIIVPISIILSAMVMTSCTVNISLLKKYFYKKY